MVFAPQESTSLVLAQLQAMHPSTSPRTQAPRPGDIAYHKTQVAKTGIEPSTQART